MAPAIASNGQRRPMYSVAIDKNIYELYIANKMEHFSFKSACVIWVAKRLKEDWLVMLWY